MREFWSAFLAGLAFVALLVVLHELAKAQLCAYLAVPW